MSYHHLVLVLLLVGSALAGSDDDILDKMLATVVDKQAGTEVQNYYQKYQRTITTAKMLFSMRFSNGKMNIKSLTRDGEVTVDEDKKFHFKARFDAVANYNYKFIEEGFKVTVSSGLARVRWSGSVQGVISTDNCKAVLESSTIVPTAVFDVDIDSTTNDLSMTIHPPSTNDMVKLLNPQLQTYLKDNVKDLPAC